MTEITTMQNNLPATIEELSKFVLVGREKLVSVRAEIRAIDKLNLAEQVHSQKLEEAQMLGGAVLDAEARLGDLFKQIPKATTVKGNQYTDKWKNDTAVVNPKTKKEIIEDLGFTPKQAERFETMSDNKDIVEQVKAEAMENEDIPTRSQVLNLVREKKMEEKRESIQTTEPKPFTGKYDVIYADPPWQYDFSETKTRKVENHYPTMTLEDIKNLDIPCDDNAVLLMWATAPKLREALEVLTAWGFEYKTCAVWDKEIIGMGYWFRGQHELLLAGVKGKFQPPLPENRISSLYREKRSEHSRKPPFYYGIIEKMFPNGKYLELFARNEVNDKWTVWGNMV